MSSEINLITAQRVRELFAKGLIAHDYSVKYDKEAQEALPYEEFSSVTDDGRTRWFMDEKHVLAKKFGERAVTAPLGPFCTYYTAATQTVNLAEKVYDQGKEQGRHEEKKDFERKPVLERLKVALGV
ncbi:MAG: hypothetical protein H6867_00770 [Rhodospirillales bacterium]|nr:hypothetical protein [Rhodospirillales bacterium]MCB9996808.1 hypothetical protein [Rhodospirillales bacterium]